MNHTMMKKILCLVLAVGMLSAAAACGQKDLAPSVAAVDPAATPATSPVTITYYDANDSTSDVGKAYFAMVDRFSQQYKGEVEIKLEVVPNIDNLMSKVKMMFASDKNPDLVALGGYDLVSVAQKADAVVDMKPYLDADPEFASWVSPENLAFNTRDGQVLSLAAYKNAIGYFYNIDLFKQVGITPAKTWEEFWSNCDKLAAAGVTPMSMDTKDTAWSTNLLLGAIIGSDGKAGTQWMKTFHPTDYNTPEVIAGLDAIKTCFQKYAPTNSVGADYNAAENNFTSSKTAMLFNGNWAITNFTDPTKVPDGFINKVGVAIFPNETAYLSSSTGYIVGKTDKAHEDAAMKFVKYMLSPQAQIDYATTMGYMPDNPQVEFTEAMKVKNPLLINYIEQVNTAKISLQDYQSMWYPNVTDAFTTLYPELAANKLTAADLAAKLTELAKKNS